MSDFSSFRSNTNANHIVNNLNKTSQKLASNYERLSSGLRINHASDDAAGLALASRLSTDARIFTKGIENVNQGISLMNVAETALTELSNVVQRQSELANQAANSTLTRTQRQALNDEANSLVEEFNRIVNAAEYNDIKLFDNTFGSSSVQAGGGTNATINFTLASQLAATLGNGTFGSAVSYSSAAAGTYNVASGDLNGDGYADLVTSNFSDSKTGVMFNNGNGTFATVVSYSTAGGGTSTTDNWDAQIGDVDGDGDNDIVVANRAGGASSYAVLRNNGNGTFATAVTYAVGASPFMSVLADFDGDGDLDIASAQNSNGIKVLLNNGNGTFGSAVTYNTGMGTTSFSITSGDFNNDGHVDLIAGSTATDKMYIFLGNGNGTFGTAVSFASSLDVRDVEAFDFNRDGYLDIVTADYSAGSLGISLGNGNGTFAARISLAAGAAPSAVEVADVNADGYWDLVSTSESGNGLRVHLGNGNGTFASQISYAVGSSSYGLALGDFNGDGASDIATTSFVDTNEISIVRANTTTRTTMQTLSLLTTNDATITLGILEQAQARVSRELGVVAGSAGRFESAVNLLINQRENTELAVSRIQDVDVADETAQLIRNKVLQDAGTALLAQANNLPMNMLKALLED